MREIFINLRKSLLLPFLIVTASLAGWGQPEEPIPPGRYNESIDAGDTTHEYDMKVGYVLGTEAEMGGVEGEDIDEINGSVRYLISDKLSRALRLRFGIESEFFIFGSQNTFPIPDRLQSLDAILGMDLGFSEKWALRIELKPGLYGDFEDTSFDDVNMRATIGVRYLIDEDLQWLFGIHADARREIPVIPGLGVRWRFADRWTLNLTAPNPRIEYLVNDGLTVYADGEVLLGAYRVSERFGDEYGIPALNNAQMDYREMRAGLGASWKVLDYFTLDCRAGWAIDREFDFQRTAYKIETGGAPYARFDLRLLF